MIAPSFKTNILQALVFVATYSMLGVAVWGVTELETRFEAEWFLPPGNVSKPSYIKICSM